MMGERITIARITGEGIGERDLSLSHDDVKILIEDNDGLISEDIDAAFKFGVFDDLLITLEFNPNSFLPCKLFGGESIVKPGTYYLMSGISLLDESGAEIMRVETPGESPIISKNGDAVEGEEITAHEITLPFEGEKPQTFEGYIFRKDSGEYVNLADVSNAGIRAITVDYMLAYSLANNEIPPELIGEGIPPRILELSEKINRQASETAKEKAEEITLAQFAARDAFLNHSLAMKTLEGMISIAYGEATSYELTPRKGSRSGESYRLTASEDACARFFAEDGGNAQIMEKILETVHTLIKDERAEGFVYSGRVWFTTVKILEEVLRTQGGTIKQARHSVNKKMVDDALLAASGAQIVGTSPEGKTLAVTYFLNAIRRESVTFKGNTYNDVWGFDLKGWTVNDYAQELAQAYKYPLLEMSKPLTIDQAAITRFLEDKLHEGRGKLYTSKGNKQKRTKYTQTLSWAGIFEVFHPIGEMDSRQKNKLVEDFQLILSKLAEMDSKNKLHEGRPLYINAHSERQAGKGSGRGAWLNLVIEYSSNFHKPKINLF